MPDVFDMPSGVDVTFEERGGWVVNALAKDLGLTQTQAAGIVGNLGFESDGFKKLQEIRPAVAGSRGGYGWAQWTGPRRVAFEQWCQQETLEPSSDEANYGYLYVELTSSYASVMNRLRAESTLDRCVLVFGEYFEHPGGTDIASGYLPAFDDRLAYAKRALNGATLYVSSDNLAPADSGVMAWFRRLFLKPSEATADDLNRQELDRIERGES